MSEKNKPKQKKYLIRCLRCNQRSRVEGIAKCKHCGSFSVELLTKGSK